MKEKSDDMGTRCASKRLMLAIVFLLYGDQLAAGNGEVCRTKPSQDVYVPSNDPSCRDDSDNKSFMRRYGPAKKSCASDFDTTGTSSLIFTSHNYKSRSEFHFLLGDA